MKIVYFVVLATLVSCTTENVKPETAEVSFKLNHKAGSQVVTMDTMLYSIASGYTISVTRWEYFISGMQMLDGSDQVVYQNNKANYINALYDDTWLLNYPNVPLISVKKIKLCIGLVPELNISNALLNTPENIGMAWPDVMGGGYHFMKLEGHYTKGASVDGYAMHLGENGYQVYITLPVDFTVKTGTNTLQMDVDVLQWFTNPHDFDFDLDGNYTMGIPALMTKLQENGSTVISNVVVL